MSECRFVPKRFTTALGLAVGISLCPATGVLTALVISGLHSGDLVVCLAVAGAIVLMSRTGNMLAAIAGAAMIAAAVRALVRL